ncbi:MAG: 30S ribosomal protein S6 [Candidatus Niyogibacteria bacterium]|nr:30S ribosomal protein S6 [Candidatus Niyogibacteria bacterium]
MENKLIENEIIEELVDTSEFVVPSDPKFYELSYIIKPGLDETNLAQATDAVRSAISNLKGIIVEEAKPEAKRLWYKINKAAEGVRGCVKFMIKPDQIEPLKKQLDKNPQILRMSLTKVVKERMNQRQRPAAKKTTTEKTATTEEIDKQLEELLG